MTYQLLTFSAENYSCTSHYATHFAFYSTKVDAAIIDYSAWGNTQPYQSSISEAIRVEAASLREKKKRIVSSKLYANFYHFLCEFEIMDNADFR